MIYFLLVFIFMKLCGPNRKGKIVSKKLGELREVISCLKTEIPSLQNKRARFDGIRKPQLVQECLKLIWSNYPHLILHLVNTHTHTHTQCIDMGLMDARGKLYA